MIKRLVVLTMAAFILSACGKSETKAPATSAAPAAPATPAAAAPAAAPGKVELGVIDKDGMPLLAKKNNCSACHAIDHKVVGPAWMDVSKKYKGVSTYNFAGKDYPLETGLFMKVSKGGAGNWGTMPMPANSPAVPDEEIKAIIKFELGLAK